MASKEKRTAREEFARSLSGTYSAERVLELAGRLVKEQKGLSSHDLYGLALLLDDPSRGAEVNSGLNKIYDDYWAERGEKPPELEPVR
jgi:hypothetical protein